MCQVVATATITTPPVTVVCTGALATTTTTVIASTSLGIPGALGQKNVLPLPPLILVDTIWGVAGFAAWLQQQSLV